MDKNIVTLVPLEESDRAQFILDNQEAFRFGAVEKFGMRDDHYEEDGEIISRETIEQSIDAKGAEAYRIIKDGRAVGGVVLLIDRETNRNHLGLFFISPREHSRGLGFSAWQAIEGLHPETEIWETCTPYFEKRNIHFYINKCGFHAVEFFNSFHEDPNLPEEGSDGSGEMLRFEKVMK